MRHPRQYYAILQNSALHILGTRCVNCVINEAVTSLCSPRQLQVRRCLPICSRRRGTQNSVRPTWSPKAELGRSSVCSTSTSPVAAPPAHAVESPASLLKSATEFGAPPALPPTRHVTPVAPSCENGITPNSGVSPSTVTHPEFPAPPQAPVLGAAAEVLPLRLNHLCHHGLGTYQPSVYMYVNTPYYPVCAMHGGIPSAYTLVPVFVSPAGGNRVPLAEGT